MAQVISEAAKNHALVMELCSGRAFLAELERKNKIAQQLASQEARAFRGARGGTMKLIGCIPQDDYMRIGNAQGFEIFDDRKEIRDYFKRNSHLKSANA